MSLTDLNRAIERGDLEGARRIFEPLSTDAAISAEARARSAFRLSVAFRNSGNFSAADELYRFMESLGDSEEVILTRARAAFNLFESYRKADMLSEAKEIHLSMRKLPQTDEINLLTALAAANLVETLSKAGEEDAAREVYRRMEDIGCSEELSAIRATCAVFLLESCERSKDYPNARKIFDSLLELGAGDSEDVSAACAGSCPVMARICCQAGRVSEAKEVYRLVSAMVDKFFYLWEKKDEVFGVIYEATGETEF
ncbi:MAG: hypothetical protein LBR53_08050 [Deltaproteobacteria bacterium]|jgi:tetratricopeptide (TPR) repeat protein|nr:hypothetical protein [Deltaproteobacteria bacterium]